MTIILFLIVLGVLIFVHELGHFIVAKATGMRVDEFAIGFPPKIYSKKIGETVYSINMIPLGGFVKIYGENPNDLKDENTKSGDGFLEKPKLSRFSVLVAGVLFNFIFAILCFSFVCMSGFTAPQGFLGSEEVGKTTVVAVSSGTPAFEAGMKTGDQISAVSTSKTKIENPTSEDAISFIAKNQNETITFNVLRDGESMSFNVTPKEGIVPDKKAIGVSFEDLINISLPVHKAFYEGYKTTVKITIATAVAMWDFFGDIFTGKDGALAQVSGPVGIATMVGQASSLGFAYLVTFTAIISINLAVLNLIPFPALDGGQIVFVIIETIIRKPISPKIVSYINIGGFAFLILLMVVITFADVLKLF